MPRALFLSFIAACGAEKTTDTPVDTTDTTTTDTAAECLGCAAFFDGTYTSTTSSSAAYDNLCADSVGIYTTLSACVCAGPCAEACGVLCPPDDGTGTTAGQIDACSTCINDAEAGCGVEAQACASDA